MWFKPDNPLIIFVLLSALMSFLACSKEQIDSPAFPDDVQSYGKAGSNDEYQIEIRLKDESSALKTADQAPQASKINYPATTSTSNLPAECYDPTKPNANCPNQNGMVTNNTAYPSFANGAYANANTPYSSPGSYDVPFDNGLRSEIAPGFGPGTIGGAGFGPGGPGFGAGPIGGLGFGPGAIGGAGFGPGGPGFGAGPGPIGGPGFGPGLIGGPGFGADFDPWLMQPFFGPTLPFYAADLLIIDDDHKRKRRRHKCHKRHKHHKDDDHHHDDDDNANSEAMF
jgi:hypothetical protein